ncbi:UbiH/UbiF/VisC/COQ6 family ubiquinone biosynthesis hydroxylase [Spongiibacter nanhainus]|uniref:UbiH/UbiF/VisC/COQ6 family ubiquinone biosynthesis hydroxylase n=2 Tax=Spongiibacter nanhainus TaxID=2794344 RepID=A0A7T4UPV2_9GAMM|nr:UbiH/UbiF/VisC/COQ6 family ubiquinone biosynthesis hydroxylase [Spongiibacter nanhainus]QQD18051.1 UbiH/UbiF/VisC/COQ6 family ubiquinone biosynthesis hydroxylase [Spongiibacter nanhainus]
MQMAEEQVCDVLIVGGGLAGGALALALADSSLRVAVVEAQPFPEQLPPLGESVADYDPRVSALTEASRRFLDSLGVWRDIVAQRACAYREMSVWDAEGTGEIHFDAADVGRPCLGHIVENRIITTSLLHRLRQRGGVQCIFGVQAESLENCGDSAVLQLADGRRLRAALVVAADGANSRVRQWAGFHTREWDYKHWAIATTVETSQSHRDTAWQRFLPEGPLAFLPLADAEGSGTFSSIVWSATPALAESLMAQPDDEFCTSLGRHFEHRLGEVVATGKRFSFPLRQRHAVDYFRGSVVLIGDAAHSIHPLAGQGINLGFADAQALAEELLRGRERQLSAGDRGVLARYQRRRKGDNLAMMAAMEGFQNLFGSSLPPLRLIRNIGMSWLDGAAPLKRRIVSRAMGIEAGV